MKVELSPTAQEDLDAIRRWIARYNRSRVISFTRELVAKINELRSAFAQYQEVDAVLYPDLRRMNYCNYRNFYKVQAGRIDVLHVHHGRRGTPTID